MQGSSVARCSAGKARDDVLMTFLKKMAITARLAGKELYRLKLSQVDLGKADLRLGEKTHATGVAQAQTNLVLQLDECQNP